MLVYNIKLTQHVYFDGSTQAAGCGGGEIMYIWSEFAIKSHFTYHSKVIIIPQETFTEFELSVGSIYCCKLTQVFIINPGKWNLESSPKYMGFSCDQFRRWFIND